MRGQNPSRARNGEDNHCHGRLERYERKVRATNRLLSHIVAGIGAAIAEYLLIKSHNVVLIARTEQPLEEFRKKYPEQVLVLAGDLEDLSLAQKAVDSALEVFGELDGLVVNHGMMDPVVKIETSNIEEWKKLFDVNFFSSVAFVSFKSSETVQCLTQTGQGSYSNIAQEQWLRRFHLLRRFHGSILNMGRIWRFQGRHESFCTTAGGGRAPSNQHRRKAWRSGYRHAATASRSTLCCNGSQRQ